MNSTFSSPTNTQASLEKKWGRLGDYPVEARDREDPLGAIEVTVIETPFGKLLGSLSFQREDVIGAIGDLVLEDLTGIKVPEAFNKAFEGEEDKLDPNVKKAQETTVFIQQFNQRLEQAQANVAPAEQQEIMMAALQNDVDTSQQALDQYGKRQLNKHDIFVMVTQQGEQREQVQEQIEVVESRSIQPNNGYNLNQVAEGGKLSAITSAG